MEDQNNADHERLQNTLDAKTQQEIQALINDIEDAIRAGAEQKDDADKAQEGGADAPWTENVDPTALVCSEPENLVSQDIPQGDVSVSWSVDYFSSNFLEGGWRTEHEPSEPDNTVYISVGADLFGVGSDAVGGQVSFGLYINNTTGEIGLFTDSGGGNGISAGIGLCFGKINGDISDGVSSDSASGFGYTGVVQRDFEGKAIGWGVCPWGPGLEFGFNTSTSETTKYPIVSGFDSPFWDGFRSPYYRPWSHPY